VDACGNTATNSVTIVAVTTPVAIPTITASGATNLCSGASVTLTASQGQTADLTYRWTRSIPGKFYDSISVANSITVTDSGSYSIQTKDKFGCVSGSGRLVKTFTNPAPTVFNVSSTGILCASSTAGQVLISGSETGTTYQSYLDGITPRTSVQGTGSAVSIPSVNFSSAGLYTVRARNNTLGCESIMNGTITVNPNTSAVPTISASGSTTFCSPGSVILTSSGVTGTYLWSTGETTNSISVSSSGSYRVSYTENGCSKNSLYQLVNANSTPNAPGNWTIAGQMSSERVNHTATVLQNGRLIVTGGTSSTFYASVELFDPVTNTDIPTASMDSARTNHTATLLNNGKLLVTGGQNSKGSYMKSSELYDPATGLWTPTGFLNKGRNSHAAILLADGKVMVIGGYNIGNVSSSEIYDPATGLWTVAAAMSTWRSGAMAVLLNNGKVLYAGGNNFQSLAVPETTYYPFADLYNPSTDTWSSGGTMNEKRHSHTITLLPNGQVLVAGGNNGVINVNTAELYNPETNTWSNTGSMVAAKLRHTATLLNNGQVLVSGGVNSSPILTSTQILSIAELYDPALGNWQTTASLNIGRYAHKANLLPNGKVVVTGGVVPSDAGNIATASAEYYSINTPIVISGINTLCAGATTQLTATVSSGVWGSNNPSIATVSSLGVVSGVNGGAVSITYTVTNASGCSSAIEYGITVNALPEATITASGPTTFCTGGSVTLTASSGSSYLWSNGATTASINVTTSGNYTVIVTNANGCSGSSAATVVRVNALPTATITVGGPTTFCVPGSVVLTSNATTGNVWSTGETTQSITVITTGNYTVTVSANGCSTVSSPVAVTANTSLIISGIGTWISTGNTSDGRFLHTATLLSNGKVLVTGGNGWNSNRCCYCNDGY
jgi:hypothetical protein